MEQFEPQATPAATSLAVKDWRQWGVAALLLVAATLACFALESHISITSQAMLYVLAVVVAAYRLEWQQSVVCAVGAVTALNFFFVPPRWTFEVESQEHLIALASMLAVALVISHLAARLRLELRHANQSERRARQLQTLASSLADANAPDEVVAQAQSALDAQFAGPNHVLLMASGQTEGELPGSVNLGQTVRDGLRCCMAEGAVLGPGTGRWPGLNAWYLPLGGKGNTLGAACVQPALAADVAGREHAQALCDLVAQSLWRVRLASAADKAKSELQRQQLQTTFLAAVSHDLRTPLAAIVGAASALQTQSGKLGDAERQRLLSSIAGEATYLSTLTENTLQLLQLNTAQQSFKRDWESMEEIVGAVLARLRERDSQRRIKAKIAAGLPLLWANPVLIAQLVSNLLDNALNYSEGNIELEVEVANGSLLVSVKDRGPDIDEAQQKQMFEPYRRGDQTGPHGAGLGLALCRAIAELHGGQLTFRLRQNGGSCFSARFPLAPQPTEENVKIVVGGDTP